MKVPTFVILCWRWFTTGSARPRAQRQLLEQATAQLILMPPVGRTMIVGGAKLVGVEEGGKVGALVYEPGSDTPFAIIGQHPSRGMVGTWL